MVTSTSAAARAHVAYNNTTSSSSSTTQFAEPPAHDHQRHFTPHPPSPLMNHEANLHGHSHPHPHHHHHHHQTGLNRHGRSQHTGLTRVSSPGFSEPGSISLAGSLQHDSDWLQTTASWTSGTTQAAAAAEDAASIFMYDSWDDRRISAISIPLDCSTDSDSDEAHEGHEGGGGGRGTGDGVPPSVTETTHCAHTPGGSQKLRPTTILSWLASLRPPSCTQIEFLASTPSKSPPPQTPCLNRGGLASSASTSVLLASSASTSALLDTTLSPKHRTSYQKQSAFSHDCMLDVTLSPKHHPPRPMYDLPLAHDHTHLAIGIGSKRIGTHPTHIGIGTPHTHPNPARLSALQKLRIMMRLYPLITIWVVISIIGTTVGGAVFNDSLNGFGTRSRCFGILYTSAKTGGGMLLFSGPLILLTMCRTLLTSASQTWLNSFIPFVHHLAFHKLQVVIAACAVMLHAGCHVARAFAALKIERKPQCARAETLVVLLDTPYKLWTSPVVLEGIALLLILVIIIFVASPWPRTLKRLSNTPLGRMLNKYNTFACTHRLQYAFWVLFWLHPLRTMFVNNKAYNNGSFANAWWFLMLPCSAFAYQKAKRIYSELFSTTRVLSVRKLAGDVIELKVSKPAFWKHKPGMFCRLKIPAVSQVEWHPFSITSAPDDPHIGFLIRASGDWTAAAAEVLTTTRGHANPSKPHSPMQHYTSTAFQQLPNQTPLSSLRDMSLPSLIDWMVGATAKRPGVLDFPDFPAIHVEGPFLAPSQEQDRFTCPMLISAGIGVTPMVSILRDACYKIAMGSALRSVWSNGESIVHVGRTCEVFRGVGGSWEEAGEPQHSVDSGSVMKNAQQQPHHNQQQQQQRDQHVSHQQQHQHDQHQHQFHQHQQQYQQQHGHHQHQQQHSHQHLQQHQSHHQHHQQQQQRQQSQQQPQPQQQQHQSHQHQRRQRSCMLPLWKDIHFYWIIPDASSICWIADTLELIDVVNGWNVISVVIYITRAKCMKDVQGVLPERVEGKVQMRFGRPDWNHEMCEMEQLYSGQDVGVFFCGPPAVGTSIWDSCLQYSANKTRFICQFEKFGV